MSLDLLPREGQTLLLAGTIITIGLNPLVFAINEALQARMRRHSCPSNGERRDDPLAALLMPVDHPPRVASALSARKIPLVVIEQNRELVGQLRELDILALAGDATDPAVLLQAPSTS